MTIQQIKISTKLIDETILVTDDFHGAARIMYSRNNYPGIGYIKNIWVDSGYRRKGHGAELLKAAEADIKEHGCSSAVVIWEVSETPLSVLCWLERRGYTHESLSKDYIKMEKSLIEDCLF